ncbi:MAG: MmcQ/YjbR family DNA-binding protein [Candidatus Adiutrix sp.]|jgi:predicted DNA-binding protein (MmcQ/YjbR family)|nr:MmcQ/YjbR family DNA-binding protein [Candidatus Adiutrix sp.]
MADMASRTTPWPTEMMERYQWLDERLQNQPATIKEFQSAWQAYKYLLHGKMYAYIGVNDKNGRPIITMKLDPAFSDAMRREYADVVPGYYMNKEHWSTVYLDGAVPQEVLAAMARASYKTLFSSLSKKAQNEINSRK